MMAGPFLFNRLGRRRRQSKKSERAKEYQVKFKDRAALYKDGKDQMENSRVQPEAVQISLTPDARVADPPHRL